MSIGETEGLTRLLKLLTRALTYVLEGKRDLGPLLQFLQGFVFGSDLDSEVWAGVYRQFGMEAEYREFMEEHEVEEAEDRWTMPVLTGVTCNKVVAVLRGLGVEVFTYVDDLDAEVADNDRDPANGSYFVGFTKNAEADEENKRKSANQLKDESHQGITLLERLLLELGYSLATAKHLDIKNVTLCSGSRYRAGDVPRVRWNPGDRRVYVSWCGLDGSSGSLRSRSVRFLSLV